MSPSRPCLHEPRTSSIDGVFDPPDVPGDVGQPPHTAPADSADPIAGVLAPVGPDVPVATQSSSRGWRAVLVLLGACAVAGALLAPLVAWLWVVLSDPPQVPLADGGGLYLGEQALNQEAGITLWFFVLGVGFGAVAGLVVGWMGQRFGWFTVVAVLVLGTVAAFLTMYLGVHVFGPDPKEEVVGARVGDLIRVGVSVQTRVAYLGWPIGALAGALAAISGWRRSDEPSPLDQPGTL